MVSDWIKITGSTDDPYTQARHRDWDQRYVWFPGTGARVAEGDRLFLYTGHPLRRFYGLCIVLERPVSVVVPRDGLRLRSRVFVQVNVWDLRGYGVPAEEVFPLPGGRSTLSLRQKSHIILEPREASLLSSRLLEAVAREAVNWIGLPIQSGLFSGDSRWNV